MQIKTMRVADLTADPANVRKHDERNIESIVGSLKRFGQQKPIVVDKSGVVRAGNGTLEAARRLGWETIEVNASELTGSEMTAYAIADNRTAELAEWDDASLAATLEGLQFEDEELLAAAGFTDDELAQLTIDAMASLDPGDDEDDADGERMDDSVTVSFPVTVEQEVIFRRAVAAAKKTLGADGTGDAVVKIMEAWNGQDQ